MTAEDMQARFDVSRETMVRLQKIVDLLEVWRARTNLIGPREWPRIWDRHIADSLQLLPYLQDSRIVVDLGSGAGFPGLVVASALPHVGRVHLVESVGKKCAFLRAAVDLADLPVDVHHARIESVDLPSVDVVTARALAPLSKLLEYSAKWLEKGALGVFLKGENATKELTHARETWNFVCNEQPSRTSDLGRILIVSEVSRRENTHSHPRHR